MATCLSSKKLLSRPQDWLRLGPRLPAYLKIECGPAHTVRAGMGRVFMLNAKGKDSSYVGMTVYNNSNSLNREPRFMKTLEILSIGSW